MKSVILVCLLICTRLFASTYYVTDYGAIPDSLSTKAIQFTIDKCHTNGGGMVYVPCGTYITGTLFLKSKVNLFLEQGAELIASTDTADFWADGEKYGMIHCENQHDVSISGPGIVNARGSFFYDSSKNHTYDEFDRAMTRQGKDYMPEGEFYTDGPIKRKPRPGMTIVFFYCSNVRFSDFTIKDTPSWAVRIGNCEDVSISGITILNNLLIPNSDGIHLTVSRNVRISDCNISAGDDAIIVTGFPKVTDVSGNSQNDLQNYENGNKTIYAENVVVTNCVLQSRSSGIRVGYGQHPIRNCIFSNIVIYGSNRGIGVFARDTSDIENIIFSNITIETRLHNGQWWGNGEPIHISAIARFDNIKVGKIKHVRFNHILARSDQGILIYGIEESKLEDIVINNLDLHITKGKETLTYGGNFDLRPTAFTEKQLFKHEIPAIYAQHVKNLDLHYCKISWDENLPPFFTHALECNFVDNLNISEFKGVPNPTNTEAKKVLLHNTSLHPE